MTQALVTGATSGIGRATALALARAGHTTVATARDPGSERARSLREEADGLPLELAQLDVTDAKSVGRLADSIGSLDILVNNAGFGVWTPLEHATRDDARRQMEVNFVGLVDLTTRMIPRLKHSEAACIVNVGSIGSRIAFPLFGLYNASKFAVAAYSLVLRVELRNLGIRVICVEPGYVETDFYGRSLQVAPILRQGTDTEYHRLSERMNRFFRGLPGSSADDVALAIVAAVDDASTPARVLVGGDAQKLASLRAEVADDDMFYAALLGDGNGAPE